MAWHSLPYSSWLSRGVHRPYVRLRLLAPGGQVPVPAIVDSGADHSIFQASLIEQLGLAPGDLIASEQTGVGGAAATRRLRRGMLKAQLVDVPGEDFALHGEFSEGVPFNLLGRSDFFRIFHVAFFEDAQAFHLRDRRKTP